MTNCKSIRTEHFNAPNDYIPSENIVNAVRVALHLFPVELVEEIFEAAQLTIEEEIVNEVATPKQARVETMVKKRSLFVPTRVKVRAKVLYGGQSRTAYCILDGDDTLYQYNTYNRIGGKQMVTLDHEFRSGMEKFAAKLRQNHQTPIYITTTNPAGHFTCYTRQVDVRIQWTPNVHAIAACL